MPAPTVSPPRNFACRRRISRVVPKTKSWKQLSHWLALGQPLLQAIALIALAAFVSGCSPLASSTDKNKGSLESGSQSNRNPPPTAISQNSLELMAEDTARTEAKEISSNGAEVVTESEFSRLSTSLLPGQEPLREGQLMALLRKRANALSLSRPKLLFIELSEDQQKKFLEGEEISLPLEALRKSSGRTKQALAKHLQEEKKSFSLHGSLYWILQDSARLSPLADQLTKSDFPLLLKFYLSPEGTAYLFLKRTPAFDPVLGIPQDSPDAALIQAALRDTKFLALVLE
jgi:hypothetical protein